MEAKPKKSNSYQGNGAALGTPGDIYIYMLPEVILIRKGERYEPKHWDVLSMAMIIYFIIKT